MRKELAATAILSSAANTAIYVSSPGGIPKVAWASLNVASMAMLFAGYGNPELMMRDRSRNALYVSTCQASKVLKPAEMAIVTKYGIDNDSNVIVTAFPESQIMRPHVAGLPKDLRGIPAAIAYCALTGTGIVYETPPHSDGTEREYFPLTQLENNLVLMEKHTGHIGHQINGLDETMLLEKMGSDDYDDVGRRPTVAELEKLGAEPAMEVPSWRMSLSSFYRAYPHGRIFINDYKEYPDLKRPVLTLYDRVIDAVFYVAINLFHRNPRMPPLFPTIEDVDDRLPIKERVWGFNVGDDYVALTEDFVKDGKGGNRNFVVGGQNVVASWDDNFESLGIWKRPSHRPINETVDVHGNVKGSESLKSLERLNTVKNGLFWYVWQNFFPQTRVNPEK